MSDDRYRFKIGDFECIALLDNTFSGEVNQLFNQTPSEEIAPYLKKHNIKKNKINGSYLCLMINTGNEDWVLIDAGAGETQEGSQLLEILKDEDIFPDHIILTHAHIDHYGGFTRDAGSPAFPNIPIYMCRDEWAVFTSKDYAEENPERAEVVKKFLMPVENQVERVECYGEVLPGISLIELPGHTPHHIGVLIESNDEALIFAGDAIIHPLSIEHPEWQVAYDFEPEKAIESRKHLSKLAVEHNALVMAYHFEFPGLGHIIENGAGYRWKTLKT